MYKSLLVLAALSAILPCQSQTPPTPAKTPGATSDYADEAAVIERQDVVYSYAADATGSKLETGVYRVQSSAALQSFAVISFPYASSNQRLDIVYIRVRKPEAPSSRRQPAMRRISLRR